MSIKLRMILMGFGLVAVIAVLGVITHRSNMVVEDQMDRNDRRIQHFHLAENMRLAYLELSLAAMDAIVDKDEGRISDERMAEIDKASNTLRTSAGELVEVMDTPETVDAAKRVEENVTVLTRLVGEELKALIEQSGQREKEMAAQFAKTDDVVDGMGEEAAQDLDALAKIFRAKVLKAGGNVARASFATKGLNEVDEMRLALSRLLLAAMDIIVDRDEGDVAPERLAAIESTVTFLDSKLPLLESFMGSTEEYELLDALTESLPVLYTAIQVDLVNLVRQAGADKVRIAAEFAAMDDTIDGSATVVGENLAVIGEHLLQGAHEATENVHHQMDSSDTLSVVISLGAMLGVAALFFLFARSILVPTGKAVRFAEAVAQGDLDRELTVRGRDEIGQLAEALRTMVGKLKAMIVQAEAKTEEADARSLEADKAKAEAQEAERKAVQARSEGLNEAANRLEALVADMSSASEELSAQVEQVSRGADMQNERMGETANAMEQLNATVLDVARSASEAADSAEQARGQATDGAQVVEQVVAAIHGVAKRSATMAGSLNQLGDKADAIGNIMNVITDIADQTNLLALNAAIEAARAGEAGRGFAVVADEVRKLAEKTMTATKEVGDAVTAIQESTKTNIDEMESAAEAVAESTHLAGTAGESLRSIVEIVDRTSDQVRSIAAASEEQSAASEEINRSVEDVTAIASETAQGMGQATQAITELARLASDLQGLIGELRQG